MYPENPWDGLPAALSTLRQGFAHLPEFAHDPLDHESQQVLQEVAQRMQDNFPYGHPLYAGQMLAPPHNLARQAYALAQLINPNNHALDGGRASSAMEKEAVAQLAGMFGWSQHLGHLTSGGTFANLEALWVAGQLHPNQRVVASHLAHYTHPRISSVLKLPFQTVDCDAQGRLSVSHLRQLCQKQSVGTVVVTMGTTALGSLDPLDQILQLREEFGFRVHVDAAYGGYFGLADGLDPEAQKLFALLSEVDSLVIDPHKHGLQPYGCGCVLFRDPQVGQFYRHDSPYTYFSSDELHLGEISLECSRAGAAAVALWATQRRFPLVKGGEFAERLSASRRAALKLWQRLQDNPHHWVAPLKPELDIVVWLPVANSMRASQVSAATWRIYEACQQEELHLAVTSLDAHWFAPSYPQLEWDVPVVHALRSCLMRPHHESWMEEIWQRLQRGSAASK
jgi:tyrosine decarboxylase/aspartate 1-decarboxylase